MFRYIVAVTAALGSFFAVPTVAVAGPVDGPVEKTAQLAAGESDTVTVELNGKETTCITVRGDGESPLELRVFNEAGEEVGADAMGTRATRSVCFRVKERGTFTVKVTNASKNAVSYTLNM